MLMVIFGAGASWDSANFVVDGATEQFRPPMGKELFRSDNLYAHWIDTYEPMRKVVHRFRGAKDSPTLEAELEVLQDRSHGRPQTRAQLIALRYYLQRVIQETTQRWSNNLHGNTNYVGLLEIIDAFWTDARKGQPVVCVSFNYDRLLDGAFAQIGVKIDSLESYISDAQYKLIKPHGSINWFHHVPVPNRALHNYYHQLLPGLADEELKASQDFFVAPEASDIDDIEGIPALSIPVAKKTQFEMPTTHLDVLKAAIPQVSHLLIIGWRGNELNFVELLNALPRGRLTLRSLVVSGKLTSAKSIATALSLNDVPPHVSAYGFSGIFGDELEDFLRKQPGQ
jgi:hypothetical protein